MVCFPLPEFSTPPFFLSDESFRQNSSLSPHHFIASIGTPLSLESAKTPFTLGMAKTKTMVLVGFLEIWKVGQKQMKSR